MKTQSSIRIAMPVFSLLACLAVMLVCWNPYGEYFGARKWVLWVRVVLILGASLFVVCTQHGRLGFWLLSSIGILGIGLASDIAWGVIVTERPPIFITAGAQIVWLILAAVLTVRQRSNPASREEVAICQTATHAGLRLGYETLGLLSGVLWLTFLEAGCWLLLAYRHSFLESFRDFLFAIVGLSLLAFIITSGVTLILKAVAAILLQTK